MKKWMLFFGLVFAIVLGGCADTDDDMEETGHYSDPGIETAGNVSEDTDKVEVTMYNQEKEAVGSAIIRPVYRGVKVTLEASDLEPGTHGFHIHENGVCEAPDFKSAGGHFNPTDAKHGFDHPEGPHAGDLPNIEVDQEGNVFADAAAEMVTLDKGEENSLLKEGGTTLVIHSDADDYESQPSGDAGKRVACGVISD
ncbi:superoxide dismutase family protein [Lentibacillus sp.]|jgi:Cu-Zn family superoxide dismutase|uniref:superoxide dismutase family protein n=1 Tax=Lentibacillus sp. TaxID=1925746 RepID=UPI002B4AE6DE|nr:superoxide dismutase family protein [Lentibacillus sp.]HLS09631.1 superoxide dismutase family protein [Lentibacillus sp.]